MTAFSPQNQPPSDLPSTPHHDLPPPDLQHRAISDTMSTFTPTFPPANDTQGQRIPQRQSGDFRTQSSNGTVPGANGNGAVPVPAVPHSRMGNGHPANMRGMGFDGPRSPPNNKSTSHVPCKFYRQGACQAGKACPFLHSDEPLAERAPCKYFTKGNCKFGGKCALLHILPDGRVVNRPNMGAGGGHLNLGGRVNLPHNPESTPGSSLLTMQAHMAPLQQPNYPYPMQDEYFGAQSKPHYDMIPTIDTTFSSHPGSQYGSPPNEGGRMPISPVQKGLSVLDATLPASFDSQGISHIARYGQLAASVPSRFGLESSPPSSFQHKAIGDSPALRNLHNSAFGDDSRNGKNGLLASSPPDTNEQPFGRRIMHSERFSKSKNMMSASLGARPPLAATDDWDEENFTFEEDLVPTALHDLLTPQEKMRRFSRDRTEDEGNTLSHRHSLSGLGASPADSNSKVGSPSAATSSPSRFGALWTRARQNEGGLESGSLPGVSAFGHVGSPLRNSSLHPGASPSMRAISKPTSGDVSPFVSSPPRQATMSMISQQLQRTRLSSRASEGSDGSGFGAAGSLHPGLGMGRVTSSSNVGSSGGGRLSVDRAVSSSSVGRERIEEEQGLFSMEEEEEMEKEKERRKDGSAGGSTPGGAAGKRYSGPWGLGFGKSSPSLGPIGGQRASSGNVGSLGKEGGVWGNGM